jgi:site-specific recombinase XerD
MNHPTVDRALTVPSNLEELGDKYLSYLVKERGLAVLTTQAYLKTAEVFLGRWCGDDLVRLRGLDAADVTHFVLSESRRGLSPRTVNETVVRLRSLLRFLFVKGFISAPLAQAAPWLAGSRIHTLPRVLDPGVGPRLLAGCPLDRPAGVRDFAILSVLTRLGLRTREITGLTLDDIDWRRGELTVRGKGGAIDKLPLPTDVGLALTGYLRQRTPSADCRHVFLSLVRPAPMTPTALSAVVRRACERVGVEPTGTHRFRHCAGAQLLRRGAALPEVGQLLRHHHLQTTAIYARVDLSALETVASPWPGAQS